MSEQIDVLTSQAMEDSLQLLAKRIREHPASLGSHHIRFQLVGSGGGVWSLRASSEGTSLVAGEGDGDHTVEVIAEADAIKRVLDGIVDGREAFLAGGIRVRGDVIAIEQLSAALRTHAPSSSSGSSIDG
jgi:hypothetical protein